MNNAKFKVKNEKFMCRFATIIINPARFADPCFAVGYDEARGSSLPR